MDKIQRPAGVGSRLDQDRRPRPCRAPPTPSLAHRQAFFAIEPPFHTRSHGVDRALLGFLFNCEEHKYIDCKRVVVWTGEIILLEQDMREIGLKLAKRYCDALREG